MLAENFRVELTEAQVEIYGIALLAIPSDKLRRAMAHGLMHVWRFFPSLAEIQDALDEVDTDVEAHAAAYAQLQQRYVQAYDEGTVPKSLPSVLEDESRAEVKRLASQVLSREQRIRYGLEHPRLMSSDEISAETLRQTEGLREHVQAKAEGRPCQCYRCQRASVLTASAGHA